MKKKILVVDDHPTMLTFMADMLGKEGHEVVTAEDGFSALNILTSFIPDIIFVDLVMPRIGGDKLCQILRKMPDLNDCQLVVVSGAVAEQEFDYTVIGADASIAKGPFEVMTEHILAVIEEPKSVRTDAVPGPIMGLDRVVGRRMTQELLSLNRHLETILESMAEGILEVFSDSIVYANSAAVSLLGMPQEELLGSCAADLFEEMFGSDVAAILKSEAGKPSEIGEDQPVEHNGKQITIKSLPVKGEASTTIIMTRDISERKRIEAQLIQAHKMETIGALVGGIAHEFNNMLMRIHGNVSLMLMDVDSTHPHYKQLKKMEEHLDNGASLTSHLLGYARKGAHDVKPVNLNQVIKETSNTFSTTSKEITIHRELAEDLFEIEADQGQIEQVLLNLYINAADAMSDGGNLILTTMNVTHQDMKGKLYEPKPGNYILLTVTDTGVGMDEETMERVFDPFFTTKDAGMSIGLGLAAAYGIIKGHGGYIHVESMKGQGTSVSIYLPARERGALESG
jgi:PAS domain S-box-containing protein